MWRFVLAASLFGALALAPIDAGADDGLKDARRAREEARQGAARAAAQLDELGAEDEQLASVLAGLMDAIAGTQAQVTEAQMALAAAEEDARQRTADHLAIEAQLAGLEADLVTIAVDQFVDGGTGPEIELFLGADSVNAGLRRSALLDSVTGSGTDLLGQIRGLRVDSERAQADARAARDEAARVRQDLENSLAQLQVQQADQQRLYDELQRRIGHWEAQEAAFEAEEAEMTDLVRELQVDILAQTAPNLTRESREGFIMPTAGGIGSGFGMRVHPIYSTRRMHNGLDIGGRSGHAIVAAKAGTVIFAGERGGYGNVVLIEHQGGVVTLYAHQSELLVSKGDRVDRGEVIGKVGTTGLSTGPHLHFEVRIGGVPQDPLLFLPV